MIVVVAGIAGWVVLGTLAAVATAAAAERLRLPGWVGAALGFAAPIVGVVAVLVLAVLPDVAPSPGVASPRDNPVLRTLDRHAPASEDAVAAHCLFTVERTRDQLRLLASEQLVRTGDDGRFVLTPQGRRLMRDAHATGPE